MNAADSLTQTDIEPGLLAVFRLLTGLRLFLLGLTACLWLVAADQRAQRFPFLGAAEMAVLFLLLVWKWPARVLGRLYLPIAILIATFGPISEYAVNTLIRVRAAPTADGTGEALFLIMLLFIPLLMVGWQYDFRAVIAFCVATTLIDAGIGLLLAPLGGPKIGSVIGLDIVRDILYLLVGFMIVRLMGAQRLQRRELAEANAQLARYASALEQLTISRERNRLARDLHDTLTHTLSALAVQLEAVNSLWESDPERAQAMLGQSLTMTRSGLVEARRAIQSLRAAPLEDLGLTLAITSLAESVASRAGLALDIYAPRPIDHLPPEAEHAIYRIADEALTNAARHAQAQHLSVRLVEDGAGRLELAVSDDGRGFDMDSPAGDNHYGLKGLKERADLIGAALEVRSRPGSGTTVRLAMETHR